MPTSKTASKSSILKGVFFIKIIDLVLHLANHQALLKIPMPLGMSFFVFIDTHLKSLWYKKLFT